MPDLSNFKLTKPLADRFREVVSGSKDGTPKWAFQMLEGDDEGYFGPESAVWEVHGCVSTIVGGIRALLLQAAHPAALAGVAEHSRYKEDPLGRLAGTTKWLTITSFGAKEFIEKEAKRVNEMHSRVTGNYLGKDGQLHDYAAKQSEYLMWVHCAFTDGFLKTYELLGYKFKTSPDQYVKEWAESAVPLGLLDAPRSVAQLEAKLEEFRQRELTANEITLDVVKFIM
ncbi:MAG: oxygenase MpaB family protein, partial [Candidatus Nanopelagicaceae bacterium]